MCQTAQPAPTAAPPIAPTATATSASASRSASSAASTTASQRPVSAQPNPASNPLPHPATGHTHTHSHDDDEDGDEDEDGDGWDDGDGDDGDDAFQKPDNSSFALSDDKATALHAQFSDVCRMLSADDNDSGKGRTKKRKSSNGEEADEKRVKELITAVYTAHVLPSAASSAPQPKRSRKKKVQCEVCYEDARILSPTDLTTEHKADDSTPTALPLPGCGHYQVCMTCLAGHVGSKVGSGDVAAWIGCPHAGCGVALHPTVLCYPGLLTTDVLLTLLLGFLTKLLSRSTAFVRCTTSQCKYGFLRLDKQKATMVCPLCHAEQAVERGKEGELDESFKAMIANGTLRACPTCQHLTLKEKGVCNVIECAKCGVWWNWRTRETGKNGSELKQRARAMGTLWEHGELQYQMELERRNPEEFKKLLERNGVAYDPNYRRGGR